MKKVSYKGKGHAFYSEGGLVREDSPYMRHRMSENVDDRRNMADPIGRKIKELDHEQALSKTVGSLEGRRDVREQATTPRDPLARLNNQGNTKNYTPSPGRINSKGREAGDYIRRRETSPPRKQDWFDEKDGLHTKVQGPPDGRSQRNEFDPPKNSRTPGGK